MVNLPELNGLDRETFIQTLSGIFERSPWIAERTESKRPFSDRSELFAALRDTVMKSEDDQKLALIRAHPDLVGATELTAESQGEQTAAGLGKLSDEEIAMFRSCNADYSELFGLPFVICARQNKKEAILAAFPHRLANSREAEIDTALGEIFKIAELRLNDVIE
jgi:2-oxo-4-hydroxy-4-carboxy-5-ureidoimidazoline decarboxylase